MKLKELKGKLGAMSEAELQGKLKESKEELFHFRFQLATGHLEDTSKLRQIRTTIARIQTLIRGKELGIMEGSERSGAGARKKKG